MPSIPLPQFSGCFTEWMSFKFQFTTLIDKNEKVTDTQKLYYFQSALIGPVKQLQNIDDSYLSLLKALKKKV